MKIAFPFVALAFLAIPFPTHAATIQQTVQFNGSTPERLYEAYLSSAETAAFLGAPAAIDPTEGGAFSAYDGHITGRLFQLVPGKLIVQSWRASHFTAAEADSTLVLTFRKNDDGAEIDLVQANVPDEMYGNVNSNWNMSYWEPLKVYLKQHPTSPKSN